ncbi:tRNA lysidine(34) synthetase TilS [Sedimenticola sp.]|uniref:tRNA lysidine(34) synthetase TilS n=1 Tax=Sedimenticola sp. TaxID=1940285 RepID=UPI003D0AC0CB
MPFTPESLLSTLSRWPRPTGILLGFSGGMDSHVLLHALAQLAGRLPAPIRAIHVDHGLQAQSATWSRHCESVCEQLAIPVEVFALQLKPVKGESLEAVAREARYKLLSRELKPDEMLLTAHHQDDQAETLLLQLLRGAGLSGLASMPALTRFAQGQHARPLLDTTRDALKRYATAAGLQWIEDDSNQDLSFDRNYLRHQVVPLLKVRWPAMARTLSRSARHCAEADRLIETLLSPIFDSAYDPATGTVSASVLNGLPSEQRSALLRLWIRRHGFASPGSTVLARLSTEVLDARLDATSLVSWPGAEVRRYRDRLYLMPPLPPFDASQTISWNGESELPLPGSGRLCFQQPEGATPASPESGRYRVVFRRGGEGCRPLGRGIRKQVKQLMQEAAVLPWMRERVPIFMIDGEVAEIAGICRCEPVLQDPLLKQLKITWEAAMPWRQPPQLNNLD